MENKISYVLKENARGSYISPVVYFYLLWTDTANPGWAVFRVEDVSGDKKITNVFFENADYHGPLNDETLYTTEKEGAEGEVLEYFNNFISVSMIT